MSGSLSRLADAPAIGHVGVPGGYLISLPPQLALVVSLRRSFRKVRAAAEAWTYFVPGPAKRLGEWIAEVELQALSERRRRAWDAIDAEWEGRDAPAAHVPSPIPFIVSLPKKRTARPLLDLLQRMADGEMLLIEFSRYRLYPSGRPVPLGIARRAIEKRLIVPSCDGLFGPEWSQSWRAPRQEETDAAAKRGGPDSAETSAAGKADRGRPVRGASARRPCGAARARPESTPVADGSRRAVARGSRGVA